MSTLLDLTAAEARRALDKGETSAVDLTTAYLDAAEATADLNAYTEITRDRALEMAAASDYRIGQGAAGRLEGIPSGSRTCFVLRVLPLPHALISCAVYPELRKHSDGKSLGRWCGDAGQT